MKEESSCDLPDDTPDSLRIESLYDLPVWQDEARWPFIELSQGSLAERDILASDVLPTNFTPKRSGGNGADSQRDECVYEVLLVEVE